MEDINKYGIKIYEEMCAAKTMPTYPFFLAKLDAVQKIILQQQNDQYRVHNNNSNNNCNECRKNNNKFYQLGNIIWPINICHRINKHQSYPSEYFIKIIVNTIILDDYITNPPLIINPAKISQFSYITLHYNKLLIIDALLKQGSVPRYLYEDDGQNKYIYSEHSGVITVKNNLVKNIIISTDTTRIDINDNNIFLPTNNELLAQHPFIFHTHPLTLVSDSDINSGSQIRYGQKLLGQVKYAGRLVDGILYEFPSANDILNFVKYKQTGIAQGSIILAPEGVYVIRPIIYEYPNNVNKKFYNKLQKYIIKIERMAISKYQNLANIHDPNVFHNNISNNMSYISLYNKFIKKINLFVEYYPRQLKNGEWIIPEINLSYINIQ